jgi:hypothetical protein
VDRSAALARFTSFCSRLRERLVARVDVVGLVWMGSTADRERVDEWSDHDFALVTTDGTEERLRADLGCRPGAGGAGGARRTRRGQGRLRRRPCSSSALPR